MRSLVPRDYWEHSLIDLLRSVRAALGPREQDKCFNIPGLGKAIPVRSGRAGLVVAIRTLNLRAAARIGVPLYCCPVVFDAIMAAGCMPRFLDVEPGTFCLSPEDLAAKRSQIDALVAVHMFGNICNINELKKAAQDRPIIEDCAQALGSKMNGRPAGSFGSIAFFSFRSGKYISAGEGGAFYSGNPDTFTRGSQLIDEMPVPSRASECAHAGKTYLKSILRNRPLYGLVGHPVWSFYNKRTSASDNDTVTQSQIYMADLKTIETRLPLLDSQIKKQRSNAEYYSENLKLAPGMICSETAGTFYNRYLYPITFASSEQRRFLATYLLHRQVDTMKYLDNVVENVTAQYGYQGDCPVAEQLSKRVLIIPSYHSLKEKDVQRIARLVNAGWTEMTKTGLGEPITSFRP